jgi:integrase
MSVWDASQLDRFAASVADDRLVALCQLAMSTGLRRGELAGLRWEDLDLDLRSLRVAVTRVAVNYRVEPGRRSRRSPGALSA